MKSSGKFTQFHSCFLFSPFIDLAILNIRLAISAPPKSSIFFVLPTFQTTAAGINPTLDG